MDDLHMLRFENFANVNQAGCVIDPFALNEVKKRLIPVCLSVYDVEASCVADGKLVYNRIKHGVFYPFSHDAATHDEIYQARGIAVEALGADQPGDSRIAKPIADEKEPALAARGIAPAPEFFLVEATRGHIELIGFVKELRGANEIVAR